ncbi:MAG: RlmE family RNA methyltransferase [Candidatus Hadarchaeales archaeon]
MGRARRGTTADSYYRMAKEMGFRSRAAFKLRQLDERYGIMRKGDVVVDLGAAPGGWTQIASRKVGPAGFVLAVDVQDMESLPGKNVAFIRGDIRDPSTFELIRKTLPRNVDVVLSDLSPRISGVWEVDHLRSIDLSRSALSCAGALLRPGGNFVVKVFQGKEFNDFISKVRDMFEFVKASKPAASRAGSAEIYVVAMGFRGAPSP